MKLAPSEAWLLTQAREDISTALDSLNEGDHEAAAKVLRYRLAMMTHGERRSRPREVVVNLRRWE